MKDTGTIFKKVSYETFKKSVEAMGIADVTEDAIKQWYGNIKLPERATTGSAGYDFFTPIGMDIPTSEGIYATIPTGVAWDTTNAAKNNLVLMICPRSSLGFKYGFRFSNTTPIIDMDYCNSDNEGHIMLSVHTDKFFSIIEGDKIAQGIITKYGVTSDDNTTGIRNGGIGSTGR